MFSRLNALIGDDPATRRVAALAFALVLLVVIFFIGTQSFESLNANEILIVQAPLSGNLKFYTSPGLKPQWFGRTVTFPKVMTYQFQDTVRFNEGGHAAVIGSVQFRLPLDAPSLTAIYTTYGSAQNLQDLLLETVTDKSIFMSGPLLSSTESYAEKRSNLIYWIEDQIALGVYRTIRRDVKTKDPVTGEDKTVSVAEIALTSDGRPQRQEQSQLQAFGIATFNFAVARMPYDAIVERQIQSQQENAMAVATAAAQARRAEQQALTAEQEGHANAATARWKQEALKATAVTEAQQRLEVARLDAQAADQERIANERRGQGEGARRRALMTADNALEQKITAWLKSQELWANAVSSYEGNWVPGVIMGGTGTQATGPFGLMEILGVKAARDLSLDMSLPRGNAAPPK